MKKLLLVDDDLDIRKIYKQVFEKSGFDVDTADDGLQALEKMKNDTWDVVLLDIQLPKLSGIEVLQTLRKEKFDLPADSYIFFLTNLGNNQVFEEANSLGVNGFFVKALLSPSQLVEHIKKYSGL